MLTVPRWIAVMCMALAVIFAARPGLAQAPQPAETQVDVLRDFTAEKKKLNDYVEQMREKHAVAVKQAKQKAIDELKKLAGAEAGSGEIAKATDTWSQVLQLAPDDNDAKVYMRAIGRIDLIEKANKQLTVAQTKPADQQILWQGENGMTIRRQPDGKWQELTPQPNGAQAQERIFTELGRNAYEIELQSVSGSTDNIHILVCRDHILRRYDADRRWTLQTTGHWVE